LKSFKVAHGPIKIGNVIASKNVSTYLVVVSEQQGYLVNIEGLELLEENLGGKRLKHWLIDYELCILLQARLAHVQQLDDLGQVHFVRAGQFLFRVHGHLFQEF
jgi:hypothetical protein